MVNDSYTGDVSPGGAPDVRVLGELSVTKVAVDPKMSNNCYLLHCTVTDEVVLIDAAAEPERLLELIGDRPLTSIVTTHQHWDHHRALAAVKAAHPGATVVAGAPEDGGDRTQPADGHGRSLPRTGAAAPPGATRLTLPAPSASGWEP